MNCEMTLKVSNLALKHDFFTSKRIEFRVKKIKKHLNVTFVESFPLRVSRII